MSSHSQSWNSSRLFPLVVAMLLAGACGTEATAPGLSLSTASSESELGIDPDPEAVSVLLDSFSIGGLYTVLPRGGYSSTGNYSADLNYAESVSRHPTGIELPPGLPVRVLAEGVYTATSTTRFHDFWCGREAPPEQCSIQSYSYSVHGLVPGPGVFNPYGAETGLRVQWRRTVLFEEIYYSLHPNAQLFSGVVPAAVAGVPSELHFRRLACCYLPPPAGEGAFETYEGSWRFGVVPDDGGRRELGIAPTIVMYGLRTDAPASAPATFKLAHVDGEPLTGIRWWFIQPASNTFSGERPTGSPPTGLASYPAGSRSVYSEIAACAGTTECAYQAASAGAVVAQSTLLDGRVLAARNIGATAPSAAEIGVTCVSGSNSATTGGTIRLTRGERIECSVTVSNGTLSSLTVTDWKFEESGTGGFTTSRAEQVTLPLGPLTWNGPMLIPGRITVLGRFAGVPDEQSASLTVAVDARDWNDRLPEGYPTQVLVRAATTEEDRFDLPVRPTEIKHLAIAAHSFRSDLGFGFSASPPVVATAREGPNYLLNYFVAVPLMLDGIEVVMNEDALSRGSEFWYAQRESAPTYSAGTPECTRSDVTSTVTRTRIYVHEGTEFQEGSHTQRYRAEYRRIVGPAMERLILPDIRPDVVFKAAALELDKQLLKAARVADEPDKNAIDFRCRFRLLQ